MRVGSTGGGTSVIQRGLWHTICDKAHVISPTLAVLIAALILTCPLYSWPLSFLATNAFADFCMFWCFAVRIVLSFANRRTRPSTIAIVSTAAALVVGVAFYFVYVSVLGEPDLSNLLFACLSGAILSALAGTWLIYVLEVYAKR